MNRSTAALIYSGGYAHSFDVTSGIVARDAQQAGWSVRIETELDIALAALPETSLLVVNALYWTMAQDEKYLPHRAEFARSMTDAQMNAIDRFVKDGGSLLAMHTATICWDNQPQWRALMGGGWQWGHSHHPPLGAVDVILSPAGRALSSGAPRFTLIDEAYHRLDPSADCRVLASVASADELQPICWTRYHGHGRVAVDALGHDTRSLDESNHAALIRGLLGWLKQSDA